MSGVVKRTAKHLLLGFPYRRNPFVGRSASAIPAGQLYLTMSACLVKCQASVPIMSAGMAKCLSVFKSCVGHECSGCEMKRKGLYSSTDQTRVGYEVLGTMGRAKEKSPLAAARVPYIAFPCHRVMKSCGNA